MAIFTLFLIFFMSLLYHQAHRVYLTLQGKAMDKNGPVMEW